MTLGVKGLRTFGFNDNKNTDDDDDDDNNNNNNNWRMKYVLCGSKRQHK
jgi:hypothetical protein